MEIRRLRPDDDRSRFRSGEHDLDRFFRAYAGQNQFKLHLAGTYVAVVEGRIVGFATVTAASIERAGLPGARLRKRLPASRIRSTRPSWDPDGPPTSRRETR